MTYSWNNEQTAIDNLRRIATNEIDMAIETADSRRPISERVHEARKACKRVRALLRLVRPRIGKTYRHENDAIRDAARLLSDLRNRRSVIESYDLLMNRFDEELDRRTFGPVRAALTRAQQEAEGDQAASQLEQFVSQMTKVRNRVSTWSVDADDDKAWRDGVVKTYRRASKRMTDAKQENSVEAFHEWRKRVKYHRHHIELLEPMFERAMTARAKAAKDLTDILGDAHDLALLSKEIARTDGFGDSERQAALEELSARYLGELRAAALSLGRRMFVDDPKTIGARWRAYWRAWQSERDLALV